MKGGGEPATTDWTSLQLWARTAGTRCSVEFFEFFIDYFGRYAEVNADLNITDVCILCGSSFFSLLSVENHGKARAPHCAVNSIYHVGPYCAKEAVQAKLSIRNVLVHNHVCPVSPA